MTAQIDAIRVRFSALRTVTGIDGDHYALAARTQGGSFGVSWDDLACVFETLYVYENALREIVELTPDTLERGARRPPYLVGQIARRALKES